MPSSFDQFIDGRCRRVRVVVDAPTKTRRKSIERIVSAWTRRLTRATIFLQRVPRRSHRVGHAALRRMVNLTEASLFIRSVSRPPGSVCFAIGAEGIAPENAKRRPCFSRPIKPAKSEPGDNNTGDRNDHNHCPLILPAAAGPDSRPYIHQLRMLHDCK